MGDACESGAVSPPPDVPHGGYGLWYSSFLPSVRVGVLVYSLLFKWLCLGVGVGAGHRGSVGGADGVTAPGDARWG